MKYSKNQTSCTKIFHGVKHCAFSTHVQPLRARSSSDLPYHSACCFKPCSWRQRDTLSVTGCLQENTEFPV